jgi:hypothetical protein
MDHEHLFEVAGTARSGGKLAAADAAFIRNEMPRQLADFPHMKLPKMVRHPGGFSVSGAPVGTFVRGALLLAGKKALGARYGGSAFYERVESDLAMRIMRSHFQGDDPKGAYCCRQCTLAILPVLEANAIRWFDGHALAHDVRRMISAGEWRFSTAPNKSMLAWALD